MPKGILYVTTRPSAPEHEAEYHAWYDQQIREIVTVGRFTSARRFAPMHDDGPFVAMYEIDEDDLEAPRSRLAKAARAGSLTVSPLVQGETVRLLREIGSYAP